MKERRSNTVKYYISYTAKGGFYDDIVRMSAELSQKDIVKLKAELSKKNPCTNPYNDNVSYPDIVILSIVKLKSDKELK